MWELKYCSASVTVIANITAAGSEGVQLQNPFRDGSSTCAGWLSEKNPRNISKPEHLDTKIQALTC